MSNQTSYLKKTLFTALTGSRQGIYATLGTWDKKIVKQTNPLVILSYHSVATDSWRFSVNASVVKKQLLFLKKNYDFITIATLQAYLKGKISLTRPSVILTFDDGYKDILVLKDFLAKQQITPALFLLSNTKKPNWKELATHRPFLTKREITSLQKAGWEIGCHSATHANLATLSDAALHEEIITSKKTLEKSLATKINYFAYPRGKYNDNVIAVIKKAKYQLAFTMDDGMINTKTDLLRIPRIGVDRTHTFAEFCNTFSPSVVTFRKLVKMSPIGRYL